MGAYEIAGYSRIIAGLLRNMLKIHIVFRNTDYPRKLAARLSGSGKEGMVQNVSHREQDRA